MGRAWPLERTLFALAGSMTLLAVTLSFLVSPWFLLLAAFVGVNQWLYVGTGALPRLDRARARRCRATVSAMSTVTAAQPAARTAERPAKVGPLGRLGGWTADHVRVVAVAWALVAVGARRLRAEGRDRALRRRLAGERLRVGSGADPRSRSNFAGLSSSALMVVVHSSTDQADEPRIPPDGLARRAHPSRRLARRLRTGCRGRRRASPQTATRQSSRPERKANPTEMVAAADELKDELRAAGTGDVAVSLTGASGMWSDFNSANRSAMMRSELYLLAGDPRDPRARLRLARRRWAAAAA